MNVATADQITQIKHYANVILTQAGMTDALDKVRTYAMLHFGIGADSDRLFTEDEMTDLLEFFHGMTPQESISYIEKAIAQTEPSHTQNGSNVSGEAEQIALRFVREGAHVIFFPRGTKRCTTPNWQGLATNDVDTAVQLARQNQYANVGIVGKQNGCWGLDDDAGLVKEYESAYGPISTFQTITVSGGRHFIFRQNDKSWQMGNVSIKGENNEELLSARIDDRYVVAAGSWAYPNNDETQPLTQYTAANPDASIIEAPDTLLKFIRTKAEEFKSKKATNISSGEPQPVHQGGRNDFLASRGGKMRQSLGWSYERIEKELLEENQKLCVPPLGDDEVKQVARSVSGYEVKNNDLAMVQQPAAPAVSAAAELAAAAMMAAAPIVDEDKIAISEEEYNRRLDEDDFPVIPLQPKAGPFWSDDVMYGICGDLIMKASEHCEAHPAGMYLDLIISLGNMIGRGPYFNINHTKHFTNDFLVRVGNSSVSRKGTGRDVVNYILKTIDPDWFDSCNVSGFGSGEAIISKIKDPMAQSVRDKKAPGGFSTVVVPGVDDKRLCIREGEIASILQLASKRESRADLVIRDGWDGAALGNVVKGRGADGMSNSACCREPMISISGDTTKSELVAKMPRGSEENGFGNRFLYCYVYRTKKCPFGGPELDFITTGEIPRLIDVIHKARKLRHVGLTKAAHKMWARLYMELDSPENQPPGLAGKMTARAAAHIRRLAIILCLLDGEDTVDSKHLQAAKRLSDYCVDSARFIFNGASADQERIEGYIKAHGPVTVRQIVEGVFQKHKTVGWVEEQADALVFKDRMYLSGIRKTDKSYIYYEHVN